MVCVGHEEYVLMVANGATCHRYRKVRGLRSVSDTRQIFIGPDAAVEIELVNGGIAGHIIDVPLIVGAGRESNHS